jgi:hypothetical protein
MATMTLRGGPCDGKRITASGMAPREKWIEEFFMEPGVPGSRFEHQLYVLDGPARLEPDEHDRWEWRWDQVYAGPSPDWPGGRWRGAECGAAPLPCT